MERGPERDGGTTAGRLPNFFVIGVNRGGTTTLHDALDAHPDVFMSPTKEPNYFAPKTAEERALWPDNVPADLTLDEYRALFAGVTDEHAIGESSTVYMSYHHTTPALIKAAVPDARLVAILRNPVDRAFSDYSLHRSWGTEPLSFADAVAAELDHDGPVGGRMRGYVSTGFYGRSLGRFLEHFDRDRLHILLFDDFVADGAGVLRSVFAFLGVDPTVEIDATIHRNASSYEPRHRGLDRIARAGAVRSTVRRVLPRRAWVRLRGYVRQKNRVVPDFPDAVRARLCEVYRDDLARASEIAGRDLSGWLA